jgi:hypothetical protein
MERPPMKGKFVEIFLIPVLVAVIGGVIVVSIEHQAFFGRVGQANAPPLEQVTPHTKPEMAPLQSLPHSQYGTFGSSIIQADVDVLDPDPEPSGANNRPRTDGIYVLTQCWEDYRDGSRHGFQIIMRFFPDYTCGYSCYIINCLPNGYVQEQDRYAEAFKASRKAIDENLWHQTGKYAMDGHTLSFDVEGDRRESLGNLVFQGNLSDSSTIIRPLPASQLGKDILSKIAETRYVAKYAGKNGGRFITEDFVFQWQELPKVVRALRSVGYKPTHKTHD